MSASRETVPRPSPPPLGRVATARDGPWVHASGIAHPDALHCDSQHPVACTSILKNYKKPKDNYANREVRTPAQWEIYSSSDQLSSPPTTTSCKRVRFVASSHFGHEAPAQPNSHDSLHDDRLCILDGHDTSICDQHATTTTLPAPTSTDQHRPALTSTDQQRPAPTCTYQHRPAPTHSSTDGSVKVQTAVRDSGVEGEDEYSPRRPEGAAEGRRGGGGRVLPASPRLAYP